MPKTKRIFGIDYDDLESFVKNKYNKRVEWSANYPEWKEKHPNKKGYSDWDYVFVEETNLDYISNFFGDNFHTIFGIIIDHPEKTYLWNEKEARHHIAAQLSPLVKLKKKKLEDMCVYHDVPALDEDTEDSCDIYDDNRNVDGTSIRMSGELFEFGY